MTFDDNVRVRTSLMPHPHSNTFKSLGLLNLKWMSSIPLIEGTPLEDIVGISENGVTSHQMDPEPREEPLHLSDLPKKTVPNYLKNCGDLIIRSRLLLEDELNLLIQTACDTVPETNKILYEGSLVSIALLIAKLLENDNQLQKFTKV